MKSILRTTSRLIAVVGLLGSAAAFLLFHLARTRMGVMRDLHVRNEPFMVVLNSPVAHWALRVLVVTCALLLLCFIRRTPVVALTGMAAAFLWLAVSFFSGPLSLATPWMMSALAVLIVGCLGMVVTEPKAKLR